MLAHTRHTDTDDLQFHDDVLNPKHPDYKLFLEENGNYRKNKG
jgi:hypothetical protein